MTQIIFQVAAIGCCIYTAYRLGLFIYKKLQCLSSAHAAKRHNERYPRPRYIDISAPSVKNIIPTTRRIAPIIKAIRMPGGTGAIVKLNINTIAMIGTTASNDSFNFSDNFVRYKFNKYSCLSVLIILQFSDYSIYSLYYHRIPILSIFLLLRSC